MTVVELMGVIIVLGLISTVAYMSYASMVPRAELHKAIRELAATIQGVRSDAIARSAPFDIVYDFEGTLDREPGYAIVSPFKVGGGLVQLSGNPESEEDEAEGRIQFDWNTLPDSVRISQIMIDGIEYSDGLLPIRFDALGSSSSHSIVLEQPRYEAFYTVEVLGLTGLVRLHEGIVIREPPDERDFE